MSLLNPVKFNQGMKQYQSKKQNRQITLPQKQITHSSKRNHRQYEFTIVLIDCRNYIFSFHRLRMSYILLEVVFFTYAHNTSCLLCLSHNFFGIYSYRLFFHTRVFILNTQPTFVFHILAYNYFVLSFTVYILNCRLLLILS